MNSHRTYCNVDSCYSLRENISFFRFPKDATRCQQWKNALGFIGDHRYANLTPEEAYSRIRVCRKHFDGKSFNSSGKHLLITAVPSKFPKKLDEKQVQQQCETAPARELYVRCKTLLKNTDSGSKGDNKKKHEFLDKKKVEDTVGTIPISQNTNKESQSDSEQATFRSEEYSLITPLSKQIETFDDAPTLALSPSTFQNPSTSQSNQITSSNYQSGQENVAKRKRTFLEDDQFEKEMLNLFKENSKIMQNDDMSFFYSLLPILQTFSTRQKLIFRSEILQKAIEMSTNNDNFSETGTSHTLTSSELQDADLALCPTFESDHSLDIKDEPLTEV